MIRAALICAAACLSLPAQAEDAEAALASLRAGLETGTIGSDTPAITLEAEGCEVTLTLENMAPNLGAVLLMKATADTTLMLHDDYDLSERQGQTTVIVPMTGGPITLDMTLTEKAQPQRDAFVAGTGGTCTEESCTAQVPSPGFPYVLFGDDAAQRARALSEAFAAYAAVCTPTAPYSAGDDPAAVKE